MSAVAKKTEMTPNNYAQALFESVQEALVVVDLHSGVLEWNNSKAQDIFKNKFHNISELETFLINPNAKDVVLLRNKKFQKTMLSEEGFYEDVILTREKDRFFDLKVHHFLEGGQKKCLMILRDVTEKRKLESDVITQHQELKIAHQQIEKQAYELKTTQEALVQSGKLAALGELAAGIAHELNQPLQTIRGYSQELEGVLSRSSSGKNGESEFLREIVQSVDKMAKIIQALRTFASQSTEGFQEVRIHEILEEVILLTHKNLSHLGIELEYKNPIQEASVYAHPTQLQQVFMNLILNAKDALIENKEQLHKKIQIEISKENPCVRIAIKDNGIGIKEENKSKILNPFFTTKEVGKGMGLGLSLSYGILKKVNGVLLVESEYKKGTEFIIKIPMDFRNQSINKGENHES